MNAGIPQAPDGRDTLILPFAGNAAKSGGLSILKTDASARSPEIVSKAGKMAEDGLEGLSGRD